MSAHEIGMGRLEPKIKITKLEEDLMEFTMGGVDLSIANALRRIMIAEVRTLAIDLVSIEENTSVLFDEFIVHRIGLLPIWCHDIAEFKDYNKCTCAAAATEDRQDFDPVGCPYCTVELELDVTNFDDETRVVTHLDIKPILAEDHDRDGFADLHKPVPHFDGSMDYAEFQTNKGIPIVKLKKNQQIKAKMVARRGCGKAHAKYNPTATVVFQYEPDVRINKNVERSMTHDQKLKVIAAAPPRMFDLDENDNLVIEGNLETIFAENCQEAASEAGFPNLFRIDQKADNFNFKLETVGSRPPADILREAIQVLHTKFEDLANDVREIAKDRMELN